MNSNLSQWKLSGSASPVDSDTNNSAGLSTESQSRKTEIQAHAVDLMYQRVDATQRYLFLLPAIIAYALWDHMSHALLVGWVAVVWTGYGARVVISYYYKRIRPGIHQARRWANYFTLTALLSGLAWGAAGMLFFIPGSAGHQVVLYTSIAITAVVSMVMMGYWLPVLYAYAIPAISLSAARFFAEGTFEYQGGAILLFLYLVIILLIGRNQQQSAYEAIRFRFENLDLVEKLREQKDVAIQACLGKSKFLAAASHDLRQPLHAMTLFADALSGRMQNPDDQLVLARLQDSLKAMCKLFNALLDISRLDAGIVEPQIKDIQLARLLNRLHGDYARQAQEKHLEWRCLPTSAMVRTDPVLLESLLRNLIGNAIRYTPQGYVAVVCREVNGEVRIEVEDSGLGIPADKHAEIFREYHQLNNPERDGAKGLGLGLAIVERLARLLNHRIELRSVPDQGSCFSVIVPLGVESTLSPDEGRDAVAETSLDSDLTGMVVLVIDDQAVVREGMKALLGRWGCEVILADSEAAAVIASTRARHPPELIIADYRLRAIRTGSQAIDGVRRELEEAIPALIITGDTAPERLREAQASGHTLMNKPVPPGRLRAFLRAVRREQASNYGVTQNPTPQH